MDRPNMLDGGHRSIAFRYLWAKHFYTLHWLKFGKYPHYTTGRTWSYCLLGFRRHLTPLQIAWRDLGLCVGLYEGTL